MSRVENFRKQCLPIVFGVAYTAATLTGCASEEGRTKTPTIQPLHPTPIPTATAERPAKPSPFTTRPQRPEGEKGRFDFLTPLTIRGGAETFFHPQGAIVNLAPGIRIGVNPQSLASVNTEGRYGIGLPPSEQILTYIVPSRASNEDERQQAMKIITDEVPLVLTGLHHTKGIEGGRIRYSIIFAGSLLSAVATANPNMRINSDSFVYLTGVEISSWYVELARLAIHEPGKTPLTTSLPQDIREAIAQSNAYPIRIEALHPDYLRALMLFRSTY